METRTIGEALAERIREEQLGPLRIDEAERMVKVALSRGEVRVVGPCASCGRDLEGGEPMFSPRLGALVCHECGCLERCEAA